MSIAEKSMGAGLKALNRLAGMEVIDRVNLRKPIERAVFNATKNGFRTAGAASRTFKAAQRLRGPVRLTPSSGGAGLFDLTPDDEQQMLQEAFGDFARQRVRPAAHDADMASETPRELLDQAVELGVTMLGVPEELGGAVSERSTVTSTLVAEALSHGDMGIAAALLAPAGVACALSLWGDADQQATYLPPFVGEDVPAAAIALQEPRPLFDPFVLQTTARADGEGFVLDGAKSLVPLAASAELFVVAANLGERGPALFLVESGTDGVAIEPEPAMGLRPAATGRLVLEGVRVGSGALLGRGEPEVYAECVARARLAWCALAVGTGRAVLDYLIPYVNERVAFGEPISHRQAVAFAVADVAIELDGLRLATLRAAARADAGKSFAREVSVARSLAADRAMGIGSTGVGLLGGHGYVREHPVEQWYRNLRAAGVMEGALLV